MSLFKNQFKNRVYLSNDLIIGREFTKRFIQ